MAATISSVEKDGNSLIITYSDGRVFERTIVYADTMVSEPPDGHYEVGNCYVDSLDRLVVNYDGGSFTIDPSAGVGDMTKAVYDPQDEGAIRLTPRASSTGAEGTIFYNSADDHVYVGTE